MERIDVPPVRRRLGDLDPSQMYEYLKSGGKSINTPPQSAREKGLGAHPSSLAWNLGSRFAGIVYAV